MAENTKIEWAHHTFNPWEGCQKVGPGCDHCYAETRNARFGGGLAPNWGPGAPRRRTSFANWQKPRRWNADAECLGIRYRVFCASLADVFDNAVDPWWRSDLYTLIEATPYLDWLLLTKRIGNVASMVPIEWNRFPDNVRIGATMVNQDEVDRDWEKLAGLPTLRLMVSIEPMLGPIVLPADFLALKPWIIVGGESGPGARPMHPDWARSLRDQCAEAGVPFLFKQHGEYLDIEHVGERWNTMTNAQRGNQQFVDGKAMVRVGKKAAGRLLDGVEHNGFPA